MKPTYFYWVALAVVAIDQASKNLVLSYVPSGSSVPLIEGVAYITTVRNPGGAFGLLESWAGLLMVITILTVAAIIVVIRRVRLTQMPTVVAIALSLELGGAVGNLIDRIRFHHVVDFINLRIWPVFNLADSAIVVGILLLAYYLFFCERRPSGMDTPASDPPPAQG